MKSTPRVMSCGRVANVAPELHAEGFDSTLVRDPSSITLAAERPIDSFT
jgi:hypothetical protein